MELGVTEFIRFGVLAILAGVLIYVFRELLRQNRLLKAESQTQALRLEAFREQVRFYGQNVSHVEAKNINTWAGTRKFRLDEIVQEATDICSFYLVPHDGKPLPTYDPGQYLTFKLNVPGQDRTVVRCYSLSDTPLKGDRYRVTIKKMGPPPNAPDAPVGVSSGYFHTNLQPGDILDCRAPRGNFYLDMAEHTPIVLIGGGVGITPMLSMIQSVAMSGSKRETWLFYGARNMAELVQAEGLKKLDDEHENIHVRFCLSEPEDNEVIGHDFDYEGFISVELMKTVLPSINYDFYVCGPPPMMTAINNDLLGAGLPETRIHYENFGPATVKKSVPANNGDSGQSHPVKFARSGREIEWNQSSGSILDLAEANNIPIDFGCRAGSCGTCSIAVREGSVDYIDEIDVEPEEGSCLACMAVPKESVVVDA